MCDGKRMVRKTVWILCGNVLFFCIRIGARYLIVKNQNLITCRLCNEGNVIGFLVYGKLVVRVFRRTLGIFGTKLKKLLKKIENTIRFVRNRPNNTL